MGVVPDQEPKITVLNTQIVKGSYLTAQMPKGVVMGDKLASAIGVERGLGNRSADASCRWLDGK